MPSSKDSQDDEIYLEHYLNDIHKYIHHYITIKTRNVKISQEKVNEYAFPKKNIFK